MLARLCKMIKVIFFYYFNKSITSHTTDLNSTDPRLTIDQIYYGGRFKLLSPVGLYNRSNLTSNR